MGMQQRFCIRYFARIFKRVDRIFNSFCNYLSIFAPKRIHFLRSFYPNYGRRNFQFDRQDFQRLRCGFDADSFMANDL